MYLDVGADGSDASNAFAVNEEARLGVERVCDVGDVILAPIHVLLRSHARNTEVVQHVSLLRKS